jgi:hypothetical protein
MFPAFPGAEGAGAYTVGGRGGQVYLVTTLDDYKPGRDRPIAGSLRAAVSARGPRIVLFRVAGYIELKDHLEIHEPQLTIAGQSAPGDGVCLKNFSLKVKAPQVVIRHLRVRPGDVEKVELDCISVGARQVILDHCSASWGIDETISTNGDSADVTVQWCLIVESLNHSVHHKGSHGYGSLISGPGAISYHHNVYAFHRSRNPRGGDGLLDFRNNLIYGWGDRAGYNGDDRMRMNYVGNYLQPLEYSKRSAYAFSPGGLHQRLYLSGNVLPGVIAPGQDDWPLVYPPAGSTAQQAAQALRADHAFPAVTVTTQSAEDARQAIFSQCGAVLPKRDAIDQRLIGLLQSGTGRLIDSQNDVGGWLPLTVADPPTDRDGDGMSDRWEVEYGLAPAQSTASAHDTDGDGYPDLEEYLNGTDPRVPEAWVAPPGVTSTAGDAFLGRTTVGMATSTPAIEIRYTLDDSEPTLNSARYEGPLEVEHSCTVRARAFAGGLASHVRNAPLLRLTKHAAVSVETAPGLRYDYWQGVGPIEFASPPPVIRSGVVETISLAPQSAEADFAVRVRGFVAAPTAGIYTFYLRCSPRGQLSIGDQLVVESQGRRRENGGKVALAAGLHPIEFLIQYPSAADKTLEIEWQGPDIDRQPLEAARLFHAR